MTAGYGNISTSRRNPTELVRPHRLGGILEVAEANTWTVFMSYEDLS